MPEVDDALTMQQIMNALDKAHEVTKRLALESMLVSDVTMAGQPVPFEIFGAGGLWGAAGKEDPTTMEHVLALSSQAPRRDDWVPDWVLAYALLFALELASDGARRLSPELRERHPDVPWAAIMELRDLIHRGVLGPVWVTAYRHLDAIVALLFPIYFEMTSGR